MGWTERKEILTSYKSIMDYIEKENDFHDYRIGNIDYSDNEVDLTIEEVIPGAKIQNSTGLVWDFHFKGVTFFEISVDVVMGFWIMEVAHGEKPNEIAFNLDSGFIGVAAEYIEFGIPSQEE
jgi:hypothetical protein